MKSYLLYAFDFKYSKQATKVKDTKHRIQKLECCNKYLAKFALERQGRCVSLYFVKSISFRQNNSMLKPMNFFLST